MHEIERELAAADVFVFFVSQSSVASYLARKELQIALHRNASGEGGAVIIPAVLEIDDSEVAKMPPLLRQFNWIDLRGRNLQAGVGKLVDAIRYWSVKLGRTF